MTKRDDDQPLAARGAAKVGKVSGGSGSATGVEPPKVDGGKISNPAGGKKNKQKQEAVKEKDESAAEETNDEDSEERPKKKTKK